MRVILNLLAVGAVAAALVVAGLAETMELYAIAGTLAVALPIALWAINRRPRRRNANREAIARPTKAATTLDVIPLPTPYAAVDDDIEGKTVRAPMSQEEAHQMHARYAPAFDQQLAVSRYVAKHGDHEATPEHDPPSFDQRRYANALQYADAFEQQLAAHRRTQAYEVARPRRIARGSYTAQQYGDARDERRDDRQRSDQQTALKDWETKTLIGRPAPK